MSGAEETKRAVGRRRDGSSASVQCRLRRAGRVRRCGGYRFECYAGRARTEA
jgi:hypothetical protein